MQKGVFINTAIMLVIAVSSLSGCSNSRIKINSNFFEKKTSTIAIGLMPYPVSGYNYICVDRGPIGCIVDIDQSRAEGLAGFLQKYDYLQIYGIKKIFADELTKRGMQAVSLNDSQYASEYYDVLYAESSSTLPHAFKTLIERTNADYLILFKIERCGVMWHVHGFNTTYGDPAAHFFEKGYLFNLQRGQVEWNYVGVFHDKHIGDKWNRPPDYLNVTMAIRDAIAYSEKKLFESFFDEQH